VIWTESRSAIVGKMVKPFFRGFCENWLLSIKRTKMVTDGGSSMHLQKASQLSNQWGTPQSQDCGINLQGFL